MTQMMTGCDQFHLDDHFDIWRIQFYNVLHMFDIFFDKNMTTPIPFGQSCGFLRPENLSKASSACASGPRSSEAAPGSKLEGPAASLGSRWVEFVAVCETVGHFYPEDI